MLPVSEMARRPAQTCGSPEGLMIPLEATADTGLSAVFKSLLGGRLSEAHVKPIRAMAGMPASDAAPPR